MLGDRETQGMTPVERGGVRQPQLREAALAPRSQLRLMCLALSVTCNFQGLDHFLRITQTLL